MNNNTDNINIPETLIPEDSRAFLRRKFAALPGYAELHVYQCPDAKDAYTRFAVQTARELGESSDKIRVFYHNADEAAALGGPANCPSLVIKAGGSEHSLLRMVGAPLGQEGTVLTRALSLAAGEEIELSKKAREVLDELQEAREIITFTSSSCPYCPSQVALGLSFAQYKPGLIRLYAISAEEFKDLAEEYGVGGVPHTVVKGSGGSDKAVGLQLDVPFAEMVLNVKHKSVSANIGAGDGFTPGADDIFGFGDDAPAFKPVAEDAPAAVTPLSAPDAAAPGKPEAAAQAEAAAGFAFFDAGAGPAAAHSGVPREKGNEFDCDLLVLGGGPAGLTAAVYASRFGLSVTVLDSGMLGGQINLTPMVENYPGFAAVSGIQLAANFVEHARLYAHLRGNLQTGLPTVENGKFKIETSNGDYYGRALLLSTGSRWRKLDIPGEVEYTGHGVHNCASCDGYLYVGKKAVVIGGGNTALTDALHLKNLGIDVTIVHRRDSFRGEAALGRAVEKSGIHVVWESIPVAVTGEGGKATGLRVRHNKTGKERELPAQGIFVSVGLIPNTDPARALGAKLDESGSIVADEHMRASLPGLYAAGDVTGGYLQIVTAVAKGALAAHTAFLDLQQNA